MVVPPQTNRPAETKAELRRRLALRRKDFFGSLDPVERTRLIDLAADSVAVRLPSKTVVAGYVAIRSEIDPMPLLERLAHNGSTVVLPHIDGHHGTMRFLAWRPGEPLDDGPFGLRQPAANAPECAPYFILTPLLGFDNALNRLGYGAGHYDRAFGRYPHARRIGLAWSIQQTDVLPTDPWDVPLHAVATEHDWIER